MTVNTRHATDTLRRLSFGAVLAAALGGAAAAPALATPAVQPVANDQEALMAAQEALQGATVQSVELEMSDGAPKWEVDVVTRTGGAYEVQVDAATGTVLSVEQNSD
ncbi:PepSY domain-containing protein [Nocardia sp. NPDC050406]|uniref:PepSY domain-containing protein n=1 Tax=Nocardia sp. NPDC050406 TaxID=3364318 RepID=UPI0037B886DC